MLITYIMWKFVYIYLYEIYTKASYINFSPTKKSPQPTVLVTLSSPCCMASLPPREREECWPLQIMKCIRNEEQRETAFPDLSLFKFLKSVSILSLDFFRHSQSKDSNIAIITQNWVSNCFAFTGFLWVSFPAISSVFLSLHIFSVCLENKTRQHHVCLCVLDKSFPLPLLPNGDVDAQNTPLRWKVHKMPAHTTEFLFCCWLQNMS